MPQTGRDVTSLLGRAARLRVVIHRGKNRIFTACDISATARLSPHRAGQREAAAIVGHLAKYSGRQINCIDDDAVSVLGAGVAIAAYAAVALGPAAR